VEEKPMSRYGEDRNYYRYRNEDEDYRRYREREYPVRGREERGYNPNSEEYRRIRPSVRDNYRSDDYDRPSNYGPPMDYREQDYGYEPRRYREERRGASRSHLRCRDIMTRDVTFATRKTSLEEVARLMRDEDTGVIPVLESIDMTVRGETAGEIGKQNGSYAGRLIGLITDRDIVIRAIAEGKDPRSTSAEEVMTTDIHTAQPNDRVIDAIRKMGDKQVRRIPVVDREGNLRGIISMADVALETEDDQELAHALEDISSGSSFWSRIFG
jgi:CBS domain-containing protein